MNPEQGKFLCQLFLNTIQQETDTTKKVIRAIPEDKKTYKPDSKAKDANELAWHIASSEMFFLDGVINGKFSEGGEAPAPPPTIKAIVEWYESNQRDRLNKLKGISAEKLTAPVSFFGVMEMPAVAYLNMMNMHSAHHRGQLSTYLRPMGSKVPSIYGGSADEPFQM
jgi:uncharacterized damage-inducible protein DinB